ncbi:unnamed protein product [Lactuca virosa]|uniref:RRM domain-containing protein n=1 Tax=Lactuca virosa TaxID=75947 RepID=A0AAU9LKU4_9ASTR|nr:unnamed protein product [Lactuca virosa]
MSREGEFNWRHVGRRKDGRGKFGYESVKDPGQHRSGRNDSKFDDVNRISVSFYVTNLPSDLHPRDLWKRCENLGTVVDTYIARKRSKMGRRFGFVRFIKVINSQELERRFCEIWFGNYHVFASLARFKRNDEVSIQHRKSQ